MTHRSNVVPKAKPLTEEQFKATFLQTLNRLIRHHGEATVAMWLGVSVRHMGNIQKGSLPSADKIWNLLAHDESAHDELDGEFGHRNVAKDAVCSNDPLTLALITVARDVAEAEAPDSPGGIGVVDDEIRRMDEPLLRKINRVTGTWLDRLEAMRRPRAVGGR